MAELFFLRHGTRADTASTNDPPVYPDYKPYDPLVTISTVGEASAAAADICRMSNIQQLPKITFYIHFSPYLRCCQTADLLALALMKEVATTTKVTPRFHLLGDFALSEWIHDNMGNQPPFVDSHEAYQMYTPNARILENRKFLLNFRPTTQLGPWNEPGLLFQEYQERCKQYFQKLIATYDKPLHKNEIVIVVAHGYTITNFMSYFLNHPIFEEIPEASVNHAHKEDEWVLKHDCLGLLERENVENATLNLESDIVYYKSNFIKKDEFDELKQFPAIGFGGLKNPSDPRASFRFELDDGGSLLPYNPLCPGAKAWNPRDANKFRVKSEFAMKVMNDEAFKKAFSLEGSPHHPVTPEVSPTSEPTRGNSTIDLVKLASNDAIYHPLKLKYSLALEVPVHVLNLRVNSHVSLAQLQRNISLSSHDFSQRRESMSVTPEGMSRGSLSPRDHDGPETPLNAKEVASQLARIRSLQRRRVTPSVDKIEESDRENVVPTRSGLPAPREIHPFSLLFKKHSSSESINSETSPKLNPQMPPSRGRRRLSSVKFVPSSQQRVKLLFYDLSSGESNSSLDEDSGDQKLVDFEAQYTWLGQNLSKKSG